MNPIKTVPNPVLFLLLILVGTFTLQHLPHLGKELMSYHVWRQTQTQQNIDNFYEEDMNILNPRQHSRGSGSGVARWEFPLMQWLIAAAYHLFGQSILVTRVCMLIFSLLSILGIFALLMTLTNRPWISLVGAWAFAYSPSFWYYSINPMPDIFALCLGIWGLTLFYLALKRKGIACFIVSGFLLGLAALQKLPFILYFMIPICHFVLKEIFFKQRAEKDITPSWYFSFILMPVAWYAWVIQSWDNHGLLSGITKSDVPAGEILEYIRFNLISVFPELLLNYAALPLFLAGMIFALRKKYRVDFRFLPLAATWFSLVGYILYEINLIGISHDYYFMPFLPFIFLVVAFGAAQLNLSWPAGAKWVVLFCMLIVPVTAQIRMLGRWNPQSPGMNKDLLEYRDDLRNAVPDDALVVAGSDVSNHIYLYFFDKKGWTFRNDSIDRIAMDSMIRNGARYLYTDSRKVESLAAVSENLDTLLLERGSVRVYSLRAPGPEGNGSDR
ncbi:MAG TPA: glycosyltransferase family 39 protein [Bacteroidales bacterium]|nr:glycosyltransferase family 39 protein [Bacteroidales bacterium]HRZ47908.1 glycosyltransferase family 39 protein [Bacteroidales bacterium]